MLKILRSSVVAISATTVLVGAAYAQQVGQVTELSGEVVVVRGTETFALNAGDAVMQGDRVITRGEGTVTISGGDCDRSLESAQSIVVDSAFCTKEVVRLSSDGSPVVQVAEAGAVSGGGVGAAPFLVGGVLAAGGAAAAAGGGGGGGEPVSP